MNQIKLFVCCHREEKVPKHPLLMPIQVGAALAGKRFDGYLHDDEGENISAKNRSYCELTAQYWSWKNVDADYYGFFHYRRYLYPDKMARRPYKICGSVSSESLRKLGYDDFTELIRGYDMILPMAENMYVTVREHYANAPYHRAKDLTLMEQIILERHPKMSEALEDYFSGTEHYFGNISIMSRAVFYDYCAWLFPLLAEFDRRADTKDYIEQEKRVDGYLAERLLGVYYTYRRAGLKVLALPRLHIEQDILELIKKKTLFFALPPGTRRRAALKRMAAKNRKDKR